MVTTTSSNGGMIPSTLSPSVTASDCQKLYSSRDKWMVSLFSGLLFLLIASPWMFNVTNSMLESFGLKTARNDEGCPSGTGMIIHGLVFLLIVRALMR